MLALIAEPGQSRYGALAAALRERILAGEWPAGTALPSEPTLAADHGVALGTLRQALGVLAAQGLIERQKGRGTFVRRGLAGPLMFRFFRFSEGDGEIPSSRILSRQVVAASAEVSRRLRLGRGEAVLRLHRLRSLGGHPRLLEEIWLPMPLFQPLAGGDPASWGDLLYPLYAERCGVHVARAEDEIGFDLLSAIQARSLQLAAGHPCAVVMRQAFDLSGRCVEWRTTRGDAHAFRYTVTLT